MSETSKKCKIKVEISEVNWKFEVEGRIVDVIELAVDNLLAFKKQLTGGIEA